jgi:hypothetical protein
VRVKVTSVEEVRLIYGYQAAVMDGTTHTNHSQHSQKLRTLCLPDVAEQICNGKKASGRREYGDHRQRIFALALTIHLQEINRRTSVGRVACGTLARMRGSLRLDQGGRVIGRLNQAGQLWALQVERRGNVGYIDVRYFHRAEWGGDAAVAAMNFISTQSA